MKALVAAMFTLFFCAVCILMGGYYSSLHISYGTCKIITAVIGLLTMVLFITGYFHKNDDQM